MSCPLVQALWLNDIELTVVVIGFTCLFLFGSWQSPVDYLPVITDHSNVMGDRLFPKMTNCQRVISNYFYSGVSGSIFCGAGNNSVHGLGILRNERYIRWHRGHDTERSGTSRICTGLLARKLKRCATRFEQYLFARDVSASLFQLFFRSLI